MEAMGGDPMRLEVSEEGVGQVVGDAEMVVDLEICKTTCGGPMTRSARGQACHLLWT